MTADAQLRDALVRSLASGCSSRRPVQSRTVGAGHPADELGALADVCRTLDRARSLGGVLADLTTAAGHVADRAALFVVRSGRLRLWRYTGFDPASLSETASARTYPLIVGGRVVAVLHAEAVHQTAGSRAIDGWPDLLDVLASYAARVIESMTLHHALGLTMPRLENAASADGVRSTAGGDR